MELENDTKVILISSDGEKIETSAKAAMRSTLIKDTIQDYRDDIIEFTANNVKGNVLKKIVEYLEHYKDTEPKEIERPLPSQNFKECVDEFDFNFTDIDLNMIFEIVLASNYLDIKPLLELASAKIAYLTKGKTTEEIRKLYGISNDFTPEEEQEILEENRWCMENL